MATPTQILEQALMNKHRELDRQIVAIEEGEETMKAMHEGRANCEAEIRELQDALEKLRPKSDLRAAGALG